MVSLWLASVVRCLNGIGHKARGTRRRTQGNCENGETSEKRMRALTNNDCRGGGEPRFFYSSDTGIPTKSEYPKSRGKKLSGYRISSGMTIV